MKPIFLISNDGWKLEQFHKNYNVLDLKTDVTFYFVLDDRKKDRSTFEVVNTFTKFRPTIIWVSDMLPKINHLFDGCRYYDEILNTLFGLSVKLLIFIYAKEVMNIEHSMLLDDDTFLLKPIDSFFEFDYVVKADGLSVLKCDTAKEAFQDMFPEIDTYAHNTARKWINSGTLIYKYHPSLLDHVRRFFNNELIYKMLAHRFAKFGHGRGGNFWIIEQNLYAINIHMIGEPHFFGGAVAFINVGKKPCARIPTLTKLPYIMHMLVANKKAAYVFAQHRLDGFLNTLPK